MEKFQRLVQKMVTHMGGLDFPMRRLLESSPVERIWSILLLELIYSTASHLGGVFVTNIVFIYPQTLESDIHPPVRRFENICKTSLSDGVPVADKGNTFDE